MANAEAASIVLLIPGVLTLAVVLLVVPVIEGWARLVIRTRIKMRIAVTDWSLIIASTIVEDGRMVEKV